MTREHSIEISSSDAAALCMLFINGRMAAVSRGSASIPVRSGQHVRWFVRPQRRNAGFTVQENVGDDAQVVFQGKCDPVVTIGEHVPAKASRRSYRATASAARARRSSPRRGAAARANGGSASRAAAPRQSNRQQASTAGRRRRGE